MKTFLISDTHFSHSNIIKYCNRPFLSVDRMNEQLVENWNSVVSPEDTVYHLGDFAFGDPTKWLERLNGKIVLILGNHDKEKSFNGKIEIHKNLILEKDGIKILLIHYPIHQEHHKDKLPKNIEWHYCFHGHIHNSIKRESDPDNILNVSVEMINYTPILIEEAISQCQNLKTS